MTRYVLSYNGTAYVVDAKTRREAISKFCEKTGVPEDFVKAHYRISNLGKTPTVRRKYQFTAI